MNNEQLFTLQNKRRIIILPLFCCFTDQKAIDKACTALD